MKKFCALFLSIILSISCVISVFSQNYENSDMKVEATNKIVAFPGAEGGGKYATGGRGGKIYHVTNLDDSGPGSLRDAVSSSNRIVIFDVGGTINLKSDIVVKGNITIAGQTAPGGGGITLKGGKLGMGGDNIIVRFISSRPGNNEECDAWGGSHGSNSIVDHCSIGWANDEQWGLYSNNEYHTVQWSIIGPANSFSYHKKGIHGFGVMFGKGQASWHHNMIAHNISRNFRGKVEKTKVMDYVNNVIYDWGYQTAYGTHGHTNYVGNYYKAGQSTSKGYTYLSLDGSDRQNYMFYLTGNKMYKSDNSLYNDVDNNWDIVDYSDTLTNPSKTGGKVLKEGYCKTDTHMPIYDFSVTYDESTKKNVYTPIKGGEDLSVAPNADSADVAFEKVLNYAGAGINANSRPDIDKQVMEEARTGTGYLSGTRPLKEANEAALKRIEENNIQCGIKYNYPKTVKKQIIDSDNDGMPDDWEIARGLDPNNASDARKDYCGKGYNNIEYYINDLTVDAFPEGVVELSPLLSLKLTVDPSAPESDRSFKTISKAVEYISQHDSSSNGGNNTIYITPGVYNEDITIDNDNVIIIPKEGTNGDIIINSINVEKNAENFFADGITFGNDNNDFPVIVSADKSVFKNCNVKGKNGAINLNDNCRAYFENCYISSENNIISGNARAVFNKCTIYSDKNGGCVASLSIEAENDYGFLFMDSIIKGSDLSRTSLGNTDGEYSQIIYWNCKMGSNVIIGENRFNNMSVEKKDKIRFMECGSKDINGNDISSAAIPNYEIVLTEAEILEKYNPFNHLKSKFQLKADNWNPGGFDEFTPQEKLQNLADSITLPKDIITKNTPVITSFSSDSDVLVSWESSDKSCFSDNTILIGEYGSGAKTATLTMTLSKNGLKDVVKKFDVIVGSISENKIADFEDENVGEQSKYINMTSNYTPNEKMTWSVTDNINENKYSEKGKFFSVKQSAPTALDESVDPGKGIYDFVFNFEEKNNNVIEVGFDIHVGDISNDGYFEAYLRGSDSIGQMRFTNDTVLVNVDENSKNRTSITSVTGEWLKFKMVADSRGVLLGKEPKVDYYLCDDDGKIIASVENARPAKAYTIDNAERFVPNKLVFRPDRTKELCEFYIDNVYFKDLTQIVKEDSEAFDDNIYMEDGKNLPVYGNHLSNITWGVVDGQSDLLNPNGTINYDKCKNAIVKAKGAVKLGNNISAIEETKDINVIITGTGENNVETEGKFFTDTDDFSSWFREFNTSSKGILLDDKTNISGNDTIKIKLPDKAVFKKFNNPIKSGKVSFSTDFLADSLGRTFRIFIENASTDDDGKGYGTAAFASDNIIYHITDIGGTTYVITSDSPTASDTSDYNGVALANFEQNKWYRINIDIDLDTKTAITSAYMHGTDGSYNPNNISNTPIGNVKSNLISKSPLGIKQIRLVKTKDGNIYFDNVSLNGPTDVTGIILNKTASEINVGDTLSLYAFVSPFEAINKNVLWKSENANVATVDQNGLVSAVAKGTAIITATTEQGGFTAQCTVTVKGAETIKPIPGDVDGEDGINVNDAALVLQYVLNKDMSGFAEGGLEAANVTNDDDITALDAAAILQKALKQEDFKFEIEE